MSHGIHAIFFRYYCLYSIKYKHRNIWSVNQDLKRHAHKSVLYICTWKYVMSPIFSNISTMTRLSRLETTAQGIRAVDTASNHSFRPSKGSESWSRTTKHDFEPFIHSYERHLMTKEKSQPWGDCCYTTVKASTLIFLTHMLHPPTATPKIKS